jgi:membrane carboxypeptidase/penicillin-binding protein
MPRPDDEHDPRIAMASTYRPPLPKRWGKKRRWPKRLLVLLAIVTLAPIATLLGGELALGLDPRLPHLARAGDFQPKVMTRLVAAGGEPLGEILDERRTIVELPPATLRALAERREPGFFARMSLGQVALARALVGHLREEPEPPSLTLALARDLVRGLPDDGLARFLKEWIVALRLEWSLSRGEIARIYLHQVRFGAGRFGVEEGARGWFDAPLARLDARQLRELADRAGSTATPPHAPPVFLRAPRFLAAAKQDLAGRFSPDELARLGATVTTTCDAELTRKLDEAIARQRLARSGLQAVAIVQVAPTHEVAAMATSPGGDADARLFAARPIGALRAPIVMAAAWSLPSDASGPAPWMVRELGVSAGLVSPIEPAALVDGRAAVTPLELASVLTTFASGGVRRQPQLIRRVGAEPESEARRATLQAMTPEVAYRVVSRLSPSETLRARLGLPVAAIAGDGASDAWFGALTPDRVVVVRVGFDDGRRLPSGGEAQRAAAAIGADALAAATRGLPARAFVAPPGLTAQVPREEAQVP